MLCDVSRGSPWGVKHPLSVLPPGGQLTLSPSFAVWFLASVKDPPDVLDRQKCLDALAALRHAKWFQVGKPFQPYVCAYIATNVPTSIALPS